MKTNLLKVTAGLGLAQLALLTSSAAAQENPGRSLNEVVVTASRSSKKQSEIGKVVRVITAETLAKSQGRTLPELLNNVAGLTIGGNGNNPGDIKSVYMRGASAANTLILIDGIPVNDASGISGQYDISAVAIDQIERVEILKGGNSTLYGSDAVAGVINIITKKGYGQALTAGLLATAGTYGTYKQALSLNGQVQNTAIALNASNLDSKGFSTASPVNGQGGFDKDGFHQKSVGLNLNQQATEKLSFRANFQLNNNNAGLDNGAFADNPNYTYDKTSFLAGLTGKLSLNKGDLTISMNQNNVKNRFNNQGSITNNIGRITHVETGFNYQLTHFVDITSGASYKYSATDQRNPFSPLPFVSDNNIKSLFTSMFFKTNGGFRAELGGRHNNHSQYKNNFTYTINPSYVFAGRYKFFVNVSSAYRVPSLYQLYSEYGNLQLKPETSASYEAGFDLDLLPGKLNLNAAFFQRKIKDVIDFGAISPGRPGYINRDKQNDKGYELELGYKPISQLNFNAFYAYVDGEIDNNGVKTFNLFRRPKNSFGTNAGVQLGKNLYASLTYKWTDERTDRYYNVQFELVDATLNAYNLLDAYLQYNPAKNLTIFTDIKNILDTDYIEFSGYATKGVNFNAGFKYDIK